MFFNQANKKAKPAAGKGATTAKTTSARKLYSVPVWMNERVFVGEFELGGRSYHLTFAPTQAEIADKRLQLRGRLTVGNRKADLSHPPGTHDRQGRPSSRDACRKAVSAVVKVDIL